MQKPDHLTTLGRSDSLNYIYLYIMVLIPANCGQYFPAKDGQGHWLFQSTEENRFPVYGAGYVAEFTGFKAF